MNKRQKDVLQYQIYGEKVILAELEKQYQKALNDINRKIRILESDELTQSRIYRLEHQKALKAQVQAILEKLHADEYSTIQQFLSASYTDGFLGTMYDLHGQGVPLIFPVDPKDAVRAVLTESKLSLDLYEALGVDTAKLTRTISTEITRGIASDLAYTDIARNISNAAKAPLSRAKTIVQTESHRIQQASTLDAQRKAKSRGADVVKQWNSTLDGETRPTHRKLDGQIREIEEPFEANGEKAMYPGGFGDPAEDCNCRCVSLTRAKWALGDDELNTLKERAEFFGLDKTEDFEDFKKKYTKAAESIEKSSKSGKMKLGNTAVRKWYKDSISKIPDSIDKTLPTEDQAKQAFESRNRIRTEARNLMADEATRKKLDQEHPNKTFEELVESKMKRKGMTREEAIRDILETATKSNANVDKELGIGED